MTGLDNPETVPGCKFLVWFVSQVWGIKVKYLHEFCSLTHKHQSLHEGPLSYLCSPCWLPSQSQIRFYRMKEDTQCGVQLDSSPRLFIRGNLTDLFLGKILSLSSDYLYVNPKRLFLHRASIHPGKTENKQKLWQV